MADDKIARLRPNETPDWPPAGSASDFPNGHEQRSSTGQIWRVVSGQWVRVRAGNDL